MKLLKNLSMCLILVSMLILTIDYAIAERDTAAFFEKSSLSSEAYERIRLEAKVAGLQGSAEKTILERSAYRDLATNSGNGGGDMGGNTGVKSGYEPPEQLPDTALPDGLPGCSNCLPGENPEHPESPRSEETRSSEPETSRR